jgi:hypothetical protein
MTAADIQAVIDKVPNLNSHGIGAFDGVPRAERSEWIKAQQADLLADVDGCTRAESWLRDKAKRKTVNPGRSSYGWKHLAEAAVGYITNGAFIAAAIHCGFPYEITPGSANPSFGISEKSAKGTVAI